MIKRITRLVMQMTLVGLVVIGCGPKDFHGEPPPDWSPPREPSISEKVASKLKLTASLPDLGDYKVVEFVGSADSLDAADSKSTHSEKCRYRIQERTTINHLSALYIKERIERTARGLPRNLGACPSRPLNFIELEQKTWLRQNYSRTKIQTLQSALEPEYFAKISLRAPAQIIESTEVQKDGLRLQLIEIQINPSSGESYSIKQWISLDSIFLERFEVENMKNEAIQNEVEQNEEPVPLINYRVTEYFVKRLSLNQK